nr:lipid II flippase MurJ [Janibacter melonis]
MASGTLVSRVLGLLRQTMTIGVVGAVGLAADAWNAANTLPNNFHLLLAGGVLNAVIVPQIVKASRRADGDEYVNRLLTLAMTIMGAATVLLTLAAPALVWLVVSKDWGDDARGLAVAFALICLPQMFFYGLYTLLGQVLTANNRFGAFMWAPALANVVAIAGLGWFMLSGRQDVQDVGLWDSTMIWVLAGSATLSIVVQALVLIPALRRIGFRYRPVWGFRGYGLGGASKMATWAFGAVAVGQVAFLLVTTPVLTGRPSTRSAPVPRRRAHLVRLRLPRLHAAALDHHRLARHGDLHAAERQRPGRRHRGGGRRPAPGHADACRRPLPRTAAMVLLARGRCRRCSSPRPPPTPGPPPASSSRCASGSSPTAGSTSCSAPATPTRTAHPFVLQLVVTVISVAFTLVGAASGFEHTATWVGVGQTVGNLVGAILGFVLLRRRLGSSGWPRSSSRTCGSCSPPSSRPSSPVPSSSA